MSKPTPYHTYEQFSVMARAQKRRIYQQNKRMVTVLSAIPAIVCVLAAFVYGVIGWLSVAETLYTHERATMNVLGFFDFIAFAIASAAMSVQGESRIKVPVAFGVYMLFDFGIHLKVSGILCGMLIYLILASIKVARHEADINILKKFEDFPFLGTSVDVKLGTYRNADVIRDLEQTAEKSIRDNPPEPKAPREEYTTRRW